MALTVKPSDGFISRLLQQAHKPAVSTVAEAPKAATSSDQVSISQTARDSSQATDNQRLESKLLQMYNQKGGV